MRSCLVTRSRVWSSPCSGVLAAAIFVAFDITACGGAFFGLATTDQCPYRKLFPAGIKPRIGRCSAL
jgi:hypothetical protein